ncbi:MAG: hypothetical protein AVDCRST_MAG05-388, partial [uncultured Rubrobacteraceae bacterium]
WPKGRRSSLSGGACSAWTRGRRGRRRSSGTLCTGSRRARASGRWRRRSTSGATPRRPRSRRSCTTRSSWSRPTSTCARTSSRASSTRAVAPS